MSFIPINAAIFGAAFAGAYSGMTGTGLASGVAFPQVGTYSGITADAYAYAQEVDAVWNNVNNTPVDVQGIQAASIVAFNNRTPHNAVLPGGFLGVASAVVNLVQAGDITLASGGTSGGGSNRALANNLTGPAVVVDNANHIMLAGILKAVKSGVFRVSVQGIILGVTPGDQTQMALTSLHQAPAFVLTNDIQVGPGPNGGIFAAVTGAGIGVTGGGATGIIQAQTSNPVTPTASTIVDWTWSGLVMNSQGGVVETPFPRGDLVIFELATLVSAGAGGIFLGSMSLEEI